MSLINQLYTLAVFQTSFKTKMTLKLYCDLFSQPSRALYMVLKYSNTPFENKVINLMKREQLTPQYKAINRFQKVPAIDHDGFMLSESVAILRYFAREGLIVESLYPNDVKKQARVDEFLAWHHIGLRLHLSLYFITGFLDPLKTGQPVNEKQLKNFKGKMESALDILENQWLGHGQRFLLGDQVTASDVIAACEVEQPRLLGYDATDKYPNIAKWMISVKNELNPHYDEAHKVFNIVCQKQQQKSG